jgi:hypothetical protein
MQHAKQQSLTRGGRDSILQETPSSPSQTENRVLLEHCTQLLHSCSWDAKVFWKPGQRPTTRNRVSHKHFQPDAEKIRRAQKVLRAKTETGTIERALDAAIAGHKRDRLAIEADERFV